MSNTESIAEIRQKLDVKPPHESIDYLNLLIYGEPGAGKTHLAGTAEDSKLTSPLLFLDVEGGSTTIRKRRGVDVVQIRSMKQLEKIQNDLFKDTSEYYKTLVIDSLTELQKLDMRVIMQQAFNKNPDKVDIDVPSMREWGKSLEHMRMIIRAFRDLPMNTICTCLLGSEKDENESTIYFPLLPGKLRSEVPGYFDVVGYLYAKEEKEGVQRHLQVAKTKKVIAKDRTDSLGLVIDNPTIPMMWETIEAAA